MAVGGAPSSGPPSRAHRGPTAEAAPPGGTSRVFSTAGHASYASYASYAGYAGYH